MVLLRSFACRLAKTKFGQKSMTRPDGLSILKKRPDRRVYVGLILIAMSYIIGLPALAVLSYLSMKLSSPMTIVVGGPAAILLMHIIFGAGVYFSGQNYAVELMQRATKQFLKKYI